jgi:hypothetical protein
VRLPIFYSKRLICDVCEDAAFGRERVRVTRSWSETLKSASTRRRFWPRLLTARGVSSSPLSQDERTAGSRAFLAHWGTASVVISIEGRRSAFGKEARTATLGLLRRLPTVDQKRVSNEQQFHESLLLDIGAFLRSFARFYSWHASMACVRSPQWKLKGIGLRCNESSKFSKARNREITSACGPQSLPDGHISRHFPDRSRVQQRRCLEMAVSR